MAASGDSSVAGPPALLGLALCCQSPTAPIYLQRHEPYRLRSGYPAGQCRLLDAPIWTDHGPLRPLHPHLCAQPAGADEPPSSALHQPRPYRGRGAQHRWARARRPSSEGVQGLTSFQAEVAEVQVPLSIVESRQAHVGSSKVRAPHSRQPHPIPEDSAAAFLSSVRPG